MKKIINCLLCNNEAILKTNKQKGYQEPDIYSIYYCPFCNTSFSMPRTETKNIYQLIYKKGYMVPGYDRYWRYADQVLQEKKPFQYLAKQEPIYWSIWYALKQKLSITKSAKILEVGSGLGYLTYALQKDGYSDVIGLDIAQEAVDRANRKYGNNYICADIYEYAPQNENTYDVIILTEVIEHVENPIEFMEALSKMLKTKGVLLLTTPNKSYSFPEKIWDTDLPPVHYWWFSEDSIKYIANKLYVKVDFVNFKKYYWNKIRTASKKKLINRDDQLHRFDVNGEIIRRENPPPNKKLMQRTWYYKIGAKIVLDILYFSHLYKCKYYYISGRKAWIMCALIKKIQ